MNMLLAMRTQHSAKPPRAMLWERTEIRHLHTRCDICRQPGRTTRGGMLLCRDCAEAARPHEGDDPYDDITAGD
jgi:hypothetical protein